MNKIEFTSSMNQWDYFCALKEAGPGEHIIQATSDIVAKVGSFVFDYSESYCVKNGLQPSGPGNDLPLVKLSADRMRGGNYNYDRIRVNDHDWDESLVNIPLKDQAERIVDRVTKDNSVRVPLDEKILTAIRNHCYNMEVNPYGVNVDKESNEIVIRITGQQKSVRSLVMSAADTAVLTGESTDLQIDDNQANYARVILSEFNKISDNKVSLVRDQERWMVAERSEYSTRSRPGSIKSQVESALEILSESKEPVEFDCDQSKTQYVRSIVSQYNRINETSISVTGTENGVVFYLQSEMIDPDELVGPLVNEIRKLPKVGTITGDQYESVENQLAKLREELEERVSLEFT